MELFGKKFNKIKGDAGEKLACKFLKQSKYKILETNFKNKIGEIDIIAKCKNIWVFVEVKSRKSELFGLPAEAVGEKKQRKIEAVASEYLQKNKIENAEVRFDVVEVLDGHINHIISAF